MASGVVSAARMMISDVPRLSVFVAGRCMFRKCIPILRGVEEACYLRWRLFVVGGSGRLLLALLAKLESFC